MLVRAGAGFIFPDSKRAINLLETLLSSNSRMLRPQHLLLPKLSALLKVKITPGLATLEDADSEPLENFVKCLKQEDPVSGQAA